MEPADRIREAILKAKEPEWVRNMREHYAKYGWYRQSDLRRLLGDPTKRTSVGTREELIASFMSKEKSC